MKSRRLASFVLLPLSLCGCLVAFSARAQDAQDIRLRQQERATEHAEAARALPRCCLCTKPNTDGFCTRLTGVTSCNAYRESSSFQSLPRENQNTLTDYACRDLDPIACEHSAAPAPSTTPDATPQSAPSGTTDSQTSCPHTFANFTAVAADIRPIAPALPPDPNPFVSLTPALSVPIPGLVFSPARREGPMVYVPFLAQYIAAVERYATGLALIAAVVMIVYGGFRYLLGSAFGDIASGKQIILDAIIGLLLALGAYMILNTVNPNTLELPEIKLGYIEPSYYGEGEGANEPIRVGSGQSCRCSPIPQEINEASVLKVPCYRQYDSAWGALPYGANLLPAGESMSCPYSYSASLPACSGSGSQSSICQGTLGQGGCGPSSLAVVMAYYGVQVNGHLITPFDTAQYAVRSCLRPLNGGTQPSVCSSRFSQEYPGFTCSVIVANRAQVAAREIRAGHPVIFHCSRCMVTKQSGVVASGSVGAGHYMVLTGVNEPGTIFSVHDVGHEGDDAAVAISGAELNDVRVPFLSVIKPAGQGALPATAAGRCTGVTTASRGSVRGGVAFRTFTYCHGGEASCSPDELRLGWLRNQAWLLIPQGLIGQSNVTVRLFIYIHGHNTGRDPSHINGVPHDNHVLILQDALSRANPAKNIVIAGPHWMGGPSRTRTRPPVPTGHPPFMGDFDPAEFYALAVQELQRAIPGVRIRDVSFGGHSAATCAAPGPLTKTLSASDSSIPNKYGFVIYDGCMGDVMNASNFSPRGKPLLINPDIAGSGMGADSNRVNLTNRSWGLVPYRDGALTCPAYIASGIQCFKHPTEAWWSFVTSYGHGESVGPMTDLAFRALYGP